MATMSIRLSDNDKKEADILFKEMGLTINSAINMFIKQCVRNQALPFTPSVEYKPSKELLESLDELSYIESHLEEYKKSNRWEDLKKELNQDE